MNARDLEILNRRNRMTPEELAADIRRETFGPLFSSIFGAPPPAPEPTTNDEERTA